MIRGKRVGLRAIERADLTTLRDWRNIEQFRRCFREVRELNLLNQERWLERISGSANDFMFVISDLGSGDPIGVCGLVYVNWVIRSADVSFYIGKDELYIDDDGLAQEAAELLLTYGFHSINLHKLWTELYEFDAKKITFFTKQLGFKLDGILRDNAFEGGRYHNSHIYSLLEGEFVGGS
jgi:RimJ/RimL family protein N-acetyltransferase